MSRTRSCSSPSRRRLGPPRVLGAIALGVLVTLLLPMASAQGPSATLSVGSSGTVLVGLSVVDPNGSALRNAIDGNFTPLIDSLPLNSTVKASLLAEIRSLESSATGGFWFGARQGFVTPAEVMLFEEFLENAASSAAPELASAETSFLSLTFDGAAPSTSQLVSVAFEDATGPDSSPAPITVLSNYSDVFPSSGTQHTLELSVPPSPFGTASSLPLPTVEFTVTTPAGTTITGVNGLEGAHVSNDLLGWGSARASGTYAPAVSPTAEVHFGPSFPLGYILVGAGVLGVGLVAGLLLSRRQRRRRARAPNEEPARVESSGSE